MALVSPSSSVGLVPDASPRLDELEETEDKEPAVVPQREWVELEEPRGGAQAGLDLSSPRLELFSRFPAPTVYLSL